MRPGEIIVSFIITALGFITAKAWRDTIQMTIDRYIPRKNGVFANLAYTFIVTVLSVGVVLYASRKYGYVQPHQLSDVHKTNNCIPKRKLCEDECKASGGSEGSIQVCISDCKM